MFKKNISVVNTRELSGKDVKALKRDIKVNFPDLSESEVTDLIPNKAEVSLLKLSNRAQAYTCNGKNPLFFDPEGRGDLLVPSVFVLWKYPHILPSLTTYSEVSPKVLGGADLFLQGLIVPEGGLGTFSAGDLRTVVCPGNKYPFAVGLLEVSSETVAKSGLVGRGLKLLHHYPDQLWGLGSKSIPDKSFTPTRVFPQGAQGDESSDEEDEEEPGPSSAPAPANGSAADSAHPEPPTAATEALNLFGSASIGSASSPAERPEAGGTVDAAEKSVRAASAPQDPDSIMDGCLMTGLHLVPDSELPLLTSTFYAKYMLQGKPTDTSVDIKKTSYKKLSKLLSTFEKKGLLTVKLVHKQDHVSSVNRQHPLYTEAAVFGDYAKESASTAEAESRQGGASTSGVNKIDVLLCYRVPSSLRPIFGSDPKGPDHLYSADEVAAALREYARENVLKPPPGSSGASDDIKLDRFLVSYVFGKKDPQQEGDMHAFADLHQRLLSKLTLFHKIVRHTSQGEMESVHKGTLKNISVAMEDRQGGRKHITHVAHFETFSIDPSELAGQLQRKFKTNASIQKLPGKNETGKEINLQGDLLHEVPKFLEETHGIDARYVDVKARKGA